jgi:malonyl-CoA O-methyltransferase
VGECMTVNRAQVAMNFSRAAGQYDQLAVHQNAWMLRGLEWAMQAFSTRVDILDIGCGTGSFAQAAKPTRPDWRVTGLDIAPGMLEIAATRCAETVEADAENLPFEDGKFDAVFSSLALQWADDKQRAFNEIARVLKPGAASVIVTLGDKNLHELFSLAAEVGLDVLPMASAELYMKVAKQAGFDVVKHESATQCVTYPSAREFLNSIRNIGAGNAQEEHDKQAARQKIGALVETYDKRYKCEEGVIATWQPVYLSLKKR